ncbi:TadE family type IV pilus minor pilin [Plantactinospora sp. KBS50]|uniref:TadE family type IV pilus minor pilin n=1 Tax=Plantactinospora sp. KBS50 TaxID=2024580 RepID=UPI001E2E022D|nr:TadE family type IV pilus minor pilin [Plantactinospora sp. KBS50]
MAAGLPALLLLLLTGLAAVQAVTAKGQCLDAAREAALAAARGQDGAEVAVRAAPPGARISITIQDDRVEAAVTASVRALGTRLPAVRVAASAVAAIEPGGAEPVAARLPDPAPSGAPHRTDADAAQLTGTGRQGAAR